MLGLLIPAFNPKPKTHKPSGLGFRVFRALGFRSSEFVRVYLRMHKNDVLDLFIHL